jgi:hypothetical protein
LASFAVGSGSLSVGLPRAERYRAARVRGVLCLSVAFLFALLRAVSLPVFVVLIIILISSCGVLILILVIFISSTASSSFRDLVFLGIFRSCFVEVGQEVALGLFLSELC